MPLLTGNHLGFREHISSLASVTVPLTDFGVMNDAFVIENKCGWICRFFGGVPTQAIGVDHAVIELESGNSGRDRIPTGPWRLLR